MKFLIFFVKRIVLILVWGIIEILNILLFKYDIVKFILLIVIEFLSIIEDKSFLLGCIFIKIVFLFFLNL